MVTQIIFLIIGIAVGLAIGFFAFKKKDDSGQLVSDERIRAAEAIADNLRRELQNYKDEVALERSKSGSLQMDIATLQTKNDNLIEKLT